MLEGCIGVCIWDSNMRRGVRAGALRVVVLVPGLVRVAVLMLSYIIIISTFPECSNAAS